MNLPSGTPVKTSVDVAEVDFPGLLQELRRKIFNGYLCITIQGTGGVEDGTLVFDAGKVVASFYEYFRYNKTVMGDKAFVRVMNASAAKIGVIDIYQLTNEQVQLILAFNEQAISIPSERDLRAVKAEAFNADYEGEVKEKELEKRSDLLKRLKIGEIGKEE
jgi:hypothetical protein